MKDVSVILRCRNEWPIVAGTMNAFVEDFDFHNTDYEIIVVDNLSKDSTADILQDRYRRWIRNGILKVVRYNEKASTWCAANAGYEVSSGEVIMIADAHINFTTGTTARLIDGARENGGLWHPAMHMWGDTDDIRLYGMDVRLNERFWGDPCRYIPDGCDVSAPWKIPMCGASLFAVKREEVEKFGLYSPLFKAYGGGEPYLTMKWWMNGSAVWMEPRALHRHAFGLCASWKKSEKGKTARNKVMLRDGSFTREIPPGGEYLSYGSGYGVPNLEFYYNFMLASFLVGGASWLNNTMRGFQKKARDPDVMVKLAKQVVEDAKDEHGKLVGGAKLSLNALLKDPPWKTCSKHEMTLPEFMR